MDNEAAKLYAESILCANWGRSEVQVLCASVTEASAMKREFERRGFAVFADFSELVLTIRPNATRVLASSTDHLDEPRVRGRQNLRA
jgi:hypothetical protein